MKQINKRWPVYFPTYFRFYNLLLARHAIILQLRCFLMLGSVGTFTNFHTKISSHRFTGWRELFFGEPATSLFVGLAKSKFRYHSELSMRVNRLCVYIIIFEYYLVQ